MNTKRPSKIVNAEGSLIVVVAVFTAIAAFSAGSVMTAMNSYIRINHRAHNYEKAFFLADAGLAAALVELNNGGAGEIHPTNSRLYFSGTNYFAGSDWGFETSVSNIGNQKRITSVGSHLGITATVMANAAEQGTGATIHALYAHAIYVGNSSGDTNYTLQVGGTGSGADYINGDIYVNGDVTLSGNASLRNPEAYTDSNGNGHWDEGELWTESIVTTNGYGAMSQADYNAYVASLNLTNCYRNGEYDPGEAFVDMIGNGVYDSSEPYTDVDGNGVFSAGDTFTDANDNGIYDSGEGFVDLGNGHYNAGEEFQDVNGNGVWDAATAGHYEGSGWGQHWVDGTPAEPYSDEGNGSYDAGESFTDANGVYDAGETFCDDRNGTYDYGTQATGDILGMPAAHDGQVSAHGGDAAISPPDLTNMHYAQTNDVAVATATYSSGKIMDTNNPCHIFMKNPSGVTYTKITGKDDYFLQDPTDSTYGNSSQKINVKDNGNNKVYYVDGNLYIHSPSALDFKFKNPGTYITIVANGNITISDEFRYNGGTTNPVDTLCLIAMKDPAQTNSGNIYLGDASYGTGGDIHAMLYAENDFKDNNLNTSGQSDLNVFGNMSAGNQVNLFRTTGTKRTKLDVTLDRRIQEGIVTAPGVPPATTGQRGIYISHGWEPVKGTWQCHSRLQ